MEFIFPTAALTVLGCALVTGEVLLTHTGVLVLLSTKAVSTTFPSQQQAGNGQNFERNHSQNN